MYPVEELIPHRAPMRLIEIVVDLGPQYAVASLSISELSSFYVARKGVPSWIGVEYMGQTAALIAGYQLKQGLVDPHTGFLLGTRKFHSYKGWFELGTHLTVSCQELAVVGGGLANFACKIEDTETKTILAEANLSVKRRAASDAEGMHRHD